MLCAHAALLSALAAPALAQSADGTPMGTVVSTPASDATAQLPTVKVRASAGTDAASEGSGSFANRRASIVKGGAELRDIPQPVTVITRQLLDDRRLIDLTDVLQTTPGVSVDYTDSERVTYHSRGYPIDALQVDGLSIVQAGSSFIQPDTATLDRVEVLRGASGMIRGAGQPSATVNMVRKRPTAETQVSGAVTLGSWNRHRAEIDASGSLNEAGTLRARGVAVYDEKDFFQKAKHEKRQVVYGVVEADLTPDTLLTASLQYTSLDATGAWGNLPTNFDGSQLNLPRDTYLGSDWNRWNRYNVQGFVEVQQRLANDWTVKASAAQTRLRLADNGFKQTYFTRTSTTDPYQFSVATAQYSGDVSDQSTFNLTADGPFEAFGRKHQLVVGADVQRIKGNSSWGRGNLNAQAGPDIRTWDPSSSYAEQNVDISGLGSLATVTRQEGVYATASFSVTDPLTVLAGARLGWWDTYGSTATSTYAVNRELTPYLGATYEITTDLNAFIGYTQIFTPQSAKDAGGNILRPVRGDDIEAGFKGAFLDGRLNTSFTVFRISNEGAAVDDLSSPNPCPPNYLTGYCKMADGKTHSQGFELEASGELTKGWQLAGGYTNTRTAYDRSANPAQVGQPLRTLDPRHRLNVFTTYKLDGLVNGLTVGGGTQIQSDIYSTSTTGITARQAGYAIYNAMAAYRFNDRWSLQLNVNNVFDKVYYKKVDPTGISNYYGDPRNGMLTLRATL